MNLQYFVPFTLSRVSFICSKMTLFSDVYDHSDKQYRSLFVSSKCTSFAFESCPLQIEVCQSCDCRNAQKPALFDRPSVNVCIKGHEVTGTGFSNKIKAHQFMDDNPTSLTLIPSCNLV